MRLTVSVQTKTHLWWTWLQIAVRNAAAAQRTRDSGVPPHSFESADSATLSVEFQHALTAIAAAAFAMEALSKELEGAGHKLNESLFIKPQKTNAGFFVAHRIVQAFGLTGAIATALPARMERLFDLRNDSVHFESEYREGVHAHPSGINTGYELTIYTLEKSVAAVQLGFDVIKECDATARSAKYDRAASAAAREMSGIMAMLNEVIRAEDLREIK